LLVPLLLSFVAFGLSSEHDVRIKARMAPNIRIFFMVLFGGKDTSLLGNAQPDRQSR